MLPNRGNGTLRPQWLLGRWRGALRRGGRAGAGRRQALQCTVPSVSWIAVQAQRKCDRQAYLGQCGLMKLSSPEMAFFCEIEEGCIATIGHHKQTCEDITSLASALTANVTGEAKRGRSRRLVTSLQPQWHNAKLSRSMAQSHSGIGKRTHRGLRGHIGGHGLPGRTAQCCQPYYGLRSYKRIVQNSAQYCHYACENPVNFRASGSSPI